MPHQAMRRRRIRSTVSRWLCSSALSAGCLAVAGMASAATGAGQSGALSIDPTQVISLAATMGALCFAGLTAALLARAKARTRHVTETLSREIADLRLAAERAETILSADDQRVISWSLLADGQAEDMIVVGTLPETSGAPRGKAAFLAFDDWLTSESAASLLGHMEALRLKGESFRLVLNTFANTHIECIGRLAGGRPVVRFRDLSQDQLANVELSEKYQAAARNLDLFQHLLEALPMPTWAHDREGRLIFANAAYAKAVDASSAAQAVLAKSELLDSQTREAISRSRAGNAVFAKRVPLVVDGARRMFDVLDAETSAGSAGVATDVTELELVQSELRRTIDSHARTLDQLATAVAIFGPDHRLHFYNAAYQSLFGLDTKFLESHPQDSSVLDELRNSRKLPEQADYRSWRKEMLASHHAVEATSFWWHLPGGQTLRIIANPHPQGGVTYIYEDFTARLDLESKYNALTRVQGETLDHLSEGVIVFGSDGRLRLSNSAFVEMWHLLPSTLDNRPHVTQLVSACARLHDEPQVWESIRIAVAGLADTRRAIQGRIERADGIVVDYASVPLPDGATMITFANMTASVQVERALTERNEALVQADQLKNAFIQHVSYELRSPLTNIIGFAQLLEDPMIGPLNQRQQEYTGYILTSSDALLAIVNDILDLATIDAGMMQLEYSEISVRDAIEGAVNGIADRLKEANIRIKVDIAKDIGHFVVDAKRVRQILSNLLANAIAFSPDGADVRLQARVDGDEVVFVIADKGQGIASDFLPNVFDRFESRSTGARRRGAGLGLPIVRSFVTLHGGSVNLASNEGQGTAVTVRLPRLPLRKIQVTGTVAAE